MACSLFNVCLSLFLEQGSRIGKVVALDEAHKYMTDSPECQALTESLLSTIRLQRHLGARIIISTQEPTISPRLLDLCSVTIVHRFTSPDWLATLSKHLAGASGYVEESQKGLNLNGGERSNQSVTALPLRQSCLSADLFSKIISLRTGEALLFAPTAAIGVTTTGLTGAHAEKDKIIRLGHGVLKVRIRKRVTADGGMSIMAT